MTMLTLGLALSVLLVQEDVVSEAEALIERGRHLEALQVLEPASRANDDARIHFLLGSLYAAAGRLPQAIASTGRAAELEPANTAYALAHGELLYRNDRAAEALPFLEKVQAEAESLLLLAAVHEKLGHEDRALEVLARYVAAKPDDGGARIMLGQKLEAAKRYEDALGVYQAALEQHPSDAALLFHVADNLSRNRDRYAEAESHARRALEVEPDMLDAGLVLVRVLERQERYEDALQELERLRAVYPESPQVHYGLATAYQRAGRADEAQSEAELFQELSVRKREAEERDARVAVTYKKAAELLQQGKMLEAEPIFLSVLEIDPEHAQTRSTLAKIAFSKGDVAGARRWIDAAIERNDQIAEFHYLKALFALRANAPKAAAESVRRSLELDPTFPDGWSMLGSILLDSGEAAEAVECFLRAAAIEPSDAMIQLNLASAHAALGNRSEETRAMERYRRLVDPP